MNFNRKSFYGLNFNWYMVDAVGSISVFMSGYGPVPKSIFSDKDSYSRLITYFDNLPRLSKSYYSSDFQIKQINSQNNFFDEIKSVERGMYVYDNEEYTDDYNLIAIPKVKIQFSDLPLDIQRILQMFMFKDIEFDKIKKINIKNYFTCE